MRATEYCALRDYSAEPIESASDRQTAMFTAYFDDSGTHKQSDIAIAACYISTKNSWQSFVEEWDVIRREEGFDAFHMAEFVAKRDQGHEPWCNWSNEKKERVFSRIARTINKHKRVGISVGIPKKHWDGTPDWIRGHFGQQHYTFAVRMCMNAIARWRRDTRIIAPIRYTFDWEMNHSEKRIEITKILDLLTQPNNQPTGDLIGLEPRGYGFEHKEEFKPLQAADILAWQMRSHVSRMWHLGKDEESFCHAGFRLLREDQAVDLGFFTEEQIQKFVAQHDELRVKGEPFPQLYRKRDKDGR